MGEHFVVENLWIAAICRRTTSEATALKETKHKDNQKNHATGPGFSGQRTALGAQPERCGAMKRVWAENSELYNEVACRLILLLIL